ncbi:hypothetical protein ACVLV4_002261 [Rathayibacter agropyri]
MPKKTRDVIVASSDWTVPTADGVHRRTIVKGAAWTVPVVAVAVATPAAAASKTPTLKFTQGSYTGTACQTITGVQVKRTTDGTTPDPGKVVTVKLASGYTFADGTTTYSGTTDANGLITLPAIKVPSKGGDSNFAATSDALSASAPVSAQPSAGTGIFYYDYAAGAITSKDPVLNSATAINMVSDGADTQFYFQNKDGSIHDSAGTLITGTDTGVNTDPALFSLSRFNNTPTIAYKKADGIYLYDATTEKTTGPIKNSKDAIRIISDAAGTQLYFQTSDGKIYDGAGDLIPGTETGVSTDAGLVSASLINNHPTISYKKADGIYSYDYTTKTTTKTPITNSKDATAIISNANSTQFYFQTSDGSLYDGNGDILTGTKGSTSLIGANRSNSTNTIYYTKSDGIYSYDYSTGKSSTTAIANSKTATAIIADADSTQFYFQNSDGSIHDGNGDVLKGTETGVDTASGLVSASQLNNKNTVAFKKSPACA